MTLRTHHRRALCPGRSSAWRAVLARACLVVMAAMIGASSRGVASAAEPRSLWDFTPYRMQILVAADADPALSASLVADLRRDVVERIDATVGSPWDVETAVAPPSTAYAMRWRFDAVTADDLPRATLEFDKAMLVRIARFGSGYQIAVRDFDLNARVLGGAAQHEVAQRSLVGPAATDAVFEAFAPLGQIEPLEGSSDFDQKRRQIRLRAAALPTRDPTLNVLTNGQTYMPVLHTSNANGSFKSASVTPWTFLFADPTVAVTPDASAPSSGAQPAAGEKAPQAAKPRPPEPAVVPCRVLTGLRNPLSGRRRGRSEQLAVAVRPPSAGTRLGLFSASDPDYPLAGYQVHSQAPNSAATTLLGLTDSAGMIQVPPASAETPPLRLLIIKNGDEPVAKLPVLTGWEPSLRALVANDEQRLRVEGFITGLQERAVDTVARREVLLARVRARLKGGRMEDAEALFQQVKALPTLSDFQTELQAFERNVQTNDPRAKRKIDKLFTDTRQVLEKHLAEKPVNDLADELQAAKGSAPVAPAAPASGG